MLQTMADVPVEIESLLARCMGDKDFTAEMLELFRQQATAHVAELDRLQALGDAAAMTKPAHGLKGSAANLSAMKLTELTAALETAGKSADLAAATELLPQVRAEFDRVLAYFPTILKTLQA
jgi:HPt (histidine-containing phosphotransfer) domain-containing protein